MRLICAMCGRKTVPFVMIGQEAIGPQCARKAGLTPTKARRGGYVRFMRQKAKPVPQLDLFDQPPFGEHSI